MMHGMVVIVDAAFLHCALILNIWIETCIPIVFISHTPPLYQQTSVGSQDLDTDERLVKMFLNLGTQRSPYIENATLYAQLVKTHYTLPVILALPLTI